MLTSQSVRFTRVPRLPPLFAVLSRLRHRPNPDRQAPRSLGPRCHRSFSARPHMITDAQLAPVAVRRLANGRDSLIHRCFGCRNPPHAVAPHVYRFR